MIQLEKNAILKKIPHRFPMLLLDRVTITEKGVIGEKIISEKDFFIENGILASFILPEIMAQTSLFLHNSEDCLTLLTGIRDYKLFSSVKVGDRLKIMAVEELFISNMCVAKCEIFSNGELIAAGKISCCLQDKKKDGNI